jgi:hypothetical protein
MNADRPGWWPLTGEGCEPVVGEDAQREDERT